MPNLFGFFGLFYILCVDRSLVLERKTNVWTKHVLVRLPEIQLFDRMNTFKRSAPK